MNESRIGRPISAPHRRQFWPLDPRPEEVGGIREIASTLSKQCRFGGRCIEFYSVAQHSILVAELVERVAPPLAIYGLLHDAHEAFTGDIATPLKLDLWARPTAKGGQFVHEYPMAEVERRVQLAVLQALGLPDVDTEGVVEHADLVARATEARDLMPGAIGIAEVEPDAQTIVAIPPHAAERAFLATFERLRATVEPLEDQ